MKKHSDLLHQTKWDVLIVLDACRWDEFCRVFGHDLMFNSIKPVDSEACTTPQWLKKHWSGSYPNTWYISANPFINSTGCKFGGYTATKHFEPIKIIDMWDMVDKQDRVKPELVTEEAICLITWVLQRRSKDTVVVHYMQPHSPYYFPCRTQFLRQLARKYLPMKYWKMFIRKLHKTKHIALEQKYITNYSSREVKKAYYMNLADSLHPVLRLINYCKRLDLKVVITSDHAEFLGESNQWGHRQSDNDLIRTVPWVVIE